MPGTRLFQAIVVLTCISVGLAPVGSAQVGPVALKLWTDRYIDLNGRPSPDGRFFAHQYGNGNIALRDLKTGEERQVTHDGSVTEGALPIFSPDGTQLAYQWQLISVRSVSFDGSNMKTLYSNKDWLPSPAAYSPDAKWIAATLANRAQGSYRIALISVADGSVVTLKSFDRQISVGGFSSDSRHLVYSVPSFPASPGGIFTIAIGSGDEAAVVQGTERSDSPFWTPDGSAIVFTSNRSGSNGLWSVRVANGKPQASPQLVRVVPDGTAIGFTRNGSYFYGVRETKDDIYIADVDPATLKAGASRLLKTKSTGENITPAWSPDGKSIAYLRLPKNNKAVLVVHNVSSEQEQIVAEIASPSRNGGPKWFPGSDAISVMDVVSGKTAARRIGLRPAGDRIIFEPSSPGVGIRISRDGKSFFYSHREAGYEGAAETLELMKRNLQTGDEKELYKVGSPGSGLFSMDISSDGKNVAFLVNLKASQPTRALIIVPSDGGQPRELYRGSYDDPLPGALAWSPDGRFILIGAAQGETTTLLAVPTAGGSPLKTGISIPGISSPSFAPNGRRIVLGGSAREDQLWTINNLAASSR